jgi:hypothetical protein
MSYVVGAGDARRQGIKVSQSSMAWAYGRALNKATR